jgi:hypothetical protein
LFLCFDTISSNTRLRRYYEEMGFRVVGEIDGPAGHPTDRSLAGFAGRPLREADRRRAQGLG